MRTTVKNEAVQWTNAHWQLVNRKLVKKAIAEFAHELLIQPKGVESIINQYKIQADAPNTHYLFNARCLALEHWLIDENSIIKIVDNERQPLDLLAFITDFQQQLQLSDELLPTYLEEVSSTLYSCAYKYQKAQLPIEVLAKADFQTIEHAMIEGHPCFIANSGRIGFSSTDFQQYAPEADQPFKIIWLAGHKDKTCFTAINGLSYRQLLEQELGAEVIAAFEKTLYDHQVNPRDYYFIPVHPWQWDNKLTHVFAADIAQRELIYLGESQDEYSAQQSIRTLYNASRPKNFYTKGALSIVNMGFMRGLSPYYMQSTPPITDWINKLLEKDAYLDVCGFQMLGEVATMGYINRYCDRLGAKSAYNKMLSALWRESPMSKTRPEQQVMTMAALLHVDTDGNALLPELIKASGLTTYEWLQQYFKAYFSPLLHCFFKYEFVFMPHGENVMLILENHIPTGMFMKDITEEVLVYNKDIDLPEHVDRLLVDTSDELQILSLFTDVFDCFFRFMSAILEEHTAFSEMIFWRLVADCIIEYQEQHPAYKDKYKRFDFFVPQFKRCCLNRLQLNNHKQMLDLADPVNSLQLVGNLENPIAAYKFQTVLTP